LRKIFRVVLNDFFMLVFIAAWFRDTQVVRLAFFIQIIDGLVLLPVYLYMKLLIEGNSEISSPLLSQLHRLIINPTLMILLVPAVYFQKLSRKE
jgi:exosortase F-associated protein